MVQLKQSSHLPVHFLCIEQNTRLIELDSSFSFVLLHQYSIIVWHKKYYYEFSVLNLNAICCLLTRHFCNHWHLLIHLFSHWIVKYLFTWLMKWMCEVFFWHRKYQKRAKVQTIKSQIHHCGGILSHHSDGSDLYFPLTFLLNMFTAL